MRTYLLQGVVVTSTRNAPDLLSLPSHISILTPAAADADAGALLSAGVAGLVVRSYGEGGSLELPAFRGMSAEHTLVLLDGNPVNNAQHGLADLRLLPLDAIGSVELLRGGGSSAFGPNALGGVINLRSIDPKEAFGRMTAFSGSSGAVRIDASAGAPIGEFAAAAGGGISYGRGDYPFRSGEVKSVRRNADYRLTHGFIKGSYGSEGGMEGSLLVTAIDADRGTPGPFLTAANQGTARQYDNAARASGSWRMPLGAEFRVSASLYADEEYERYRDAGSAIPADNDYTNRSYAFAPSVEWSAPTDLTLRGGARIAGAAASGNALAAEQVRTEEGLFLHGEYHAPPAGLVALSLYPSIRYDRAGREGWDAWSPRCGVNLRAGEDLALHASAGRDFRVPTMNELYYAGEGGIGNPSLGPERSVSADGGVTAAAWGATIDATLYFIRTDERILWLPTANPLVYSPRSVGTTRSTGGELDGAWERTSAGLRVRAGYSWIDARKLYRSSPQDITSGTQLPFVPLETAGASIEESPPFAAWLRLGLDAAYTGGRYADEANSVPLPPYTVVNVRVAAGASFAGIRGTLEYEIRNAGGTSYESMPGYPMPLANHAVTLSLSTGKIP